MEPQDQQQRDQRRGPIRPSSTTGSRGPIRSRKAGARPGTAGRRAPRSSVPMPPSSRRDRRSSPTGLAIPIGTWSSRPTGSASRTRHSAPASSWSPSNRTDRRGTAPAPGMGRRKWTKASKRRAANQGGKQGGKGQEGQDKKGQSKSQEDRNEDRGGSRDQNKDERGRPSQGPSLVKTLLLAGAVALVCGVVGAWGYSYFFGPDKSKGDQSSSKDSGSGGGSGSSKDSGSSKGSDSEGKGNDIEEELDLERQELERGQAARGGGGLAGGRQGTPPGQGGGEGGGAMRTRRRKRSWISSRIRCCRPAARGAGRSRRPSGPGARART